MFKKLFGMAPTLEGDGSFSPSKFALKMATSDTSGYEAVAYAPYKGMCSRVLVICTEQKDMTMRNGKKFSTGNHPVETLVPMLHLQNAGFEFDIATPTGKPAVLEMWAFPSKDQNVQALYDECKPCFDEPKSLEEAIDALDANPHEYAAVFIPGGHGAMLGLPDDPRVSEILHWAHTNDAFTISICHGPAALLATSLNGGDFLYEEYNMTVFPDSVDNMTPKIGYLPGKMPWAPGEKLLLSGATIINRKADDSVCRDRKLITGASPDAANALGRLAATTLLQEL